ncbi:transposase family protein [Allosaccharopolyspora coralli]|uniref:transposase family protein n=1 Tax=Allosaccharopolyspora coralli TaxID=2665642 RepID=UPI001652844C
MVLVVRASTPPGPVTCPGCGVEAGRVHGYAERGLADVPVDGRRVVVRVWARRIVTTENGPEPLIREPRHTFRTHTFRVGGF